MRPCACATEVWMIRVHLWTLRSAGLDHQKSHTCVSRSPWPRDGWHHRYSFRAWALKRQSLKQINLTSGSSSAGPPVRGENHGIAVRQNSCHNYRRYSITSHEPLPLQEYLWPLDCCRCARWCNWRRSRQGKYFCTGNGENAYFESLEHWEIQTACGTFRE